MCFCICPPCLARAIEIWKVVNAQGQEHPDVHLSFVTFAAKCMVSLGHEVYIFLAYFCLGIMNYEQIRYPNLVSERINFTKAEP